MCSEHRPSTGVSESKEFRGRSDRQDRGIGNTKKDGKWNCLSPLLDIPGTARNSGRQNPRLD